MPRDFAHKPREPEGSHIPRWVWYFTSIAAIGFAGFLYYLSQVPPDTGGAEMVRQQLDKALSESQTSANEAEKAPQERETIADIKEKANALKQAFEFYELLENDEVAIDLPGDLPQVAPTPSGEGTSTINPTTAPATNATPIPAAGKKWIIQVASFANVADADRVRAQLILNGLPETNIESVEVAGRGTYHRVMVGPYDHRPTLNKAQDILAELNYQPLVKTQ